MLKHVFFGLALLCSLQVLQAQRKVSIGQQLLLPQPNPTLSASSLPFSSVPDQEERVSSPRDEFIQPAFVRENPTGYSFFCRLELDIEKKSPVGVWLKVTDAWQQEGNALNNLSLRLKMLRF